MSARDPIPSSDFALRFPGRFSAVLSEARGAMAGVAASAANGTRVLDPESLRRLHEIFRLRIELELEAAAVLWHTAEVVCAMADATEVLRGRGAADARAGEWLPGFAADEFASRRARRALRANQARGPSRWPDVEAPAARELEPGERAAASTPEPPYRAEAA